MSRTGKKPSPKGGGVRSATKADAAIGARVRAMRMDRQMSQEDLGKQLGVSFQQVQKYEKGANRISMVRAGQIARALETTIEQLTGTNGGLQLDGFLFDAESYKLAREFTKLPDHLKSRFRHLISSIVEGPQE